MRPDIAACLEPEDRHGTWYLIRAHHPDDAALHVRNLITGDADCTSEGACPVCFATGSWEQLVRPGSATGQARLQFTADVRLPDLVPSLPTHA